MGEVFGRLLGGLEVELDSTSGLDVEVKKDEEVVELEELDEGVEVDPGSLSEKTTTDAKGLVGSETVGVGVVVSCEIDDGSVLLLVIVEGVRLELGSGCEVVEGSTVLGVILGGELVEGGFSDVGLEALDVDGGSEDVDGGPEDVDGDSGEDVDGGCWDVEGGSWEDVDGS